VNPLGASGVGGAGARARARAALVMRTVMITVMNAIQNRLGSRIVTWRRSAKQRYGMAQSTIPLRISRMKRTRTSRTRRRRTCQTRKATKRTAHAHSRAAGTNSLPHSLGIYDHKLQQWATARCAICHREGVDP